MIDTIEDKILLTQTYGSEVYQLAAEEEIVCIVGKPGCGKTTLTKLLVKAALTGETFGTYNLKMEPHEEIMFYDTEQSSTLTNRYMQSILSDPRVTPEHLADTRFSIVPAVKYGSPGKKYERLIDYIQTHPLLKIVIADNASGLSPDVSSQSLTTEYVSNLLSVIEERKILLIMLVHANNDGSAYHVFGKAINGASSFSLSLERNNNNITVVTPRKARYSSPPTVDFTVDRKTNEIIMGPYIPFTGSIPFVNFANEYLKEVNKYKGTMCFIKVLPKYYKEKVEATLAEEGFISLSEDLEYSLIEMSLIESALGIYDNEEGEGYYGDEGDGSKEMFNGVERITYGLKPNRGGDDGLPF